jgi:hypothetical protein
MNEKSSLLPRSRGAVGHFCAATSMHAQVMKSIGQNNRVAQRLLTIEYSS